MDGLLVWITGLSGAGKTTLGTVLAENLRKDVPGVIHLDGDQLRSALGNVFGHSREERVKLAKLYSKICVELVNHGNVVVMSTIALYHQVHESNRTALSDKYLEIFLDVPIEVLKDRNSKKIYSLKQNVVGSDQHPEFPLNPHLVLQNHTKEHLLTNVELLEREIRKVLERQKSTKAL
jgi:cytidine diphosphoramidate kinase